MWAVVGLGNPGKQYAQTKHNAGFVFMRKLSKNWGTRLKKRKSSSKMIIITRDKERVLLAMPQTYMNRSGLAVKQIVQNYAIKLEKLLVVYDDFDIPVGEIRIRKEGSAGSHKGMSSIIKELGTNLIPRIRIGIGPFDLEDDASDFVLSPFRKDDKQKFNKSLEKACQAAELFLSGQAEKAMNLYN